MTTCVCTVLDRYASLSRGKILLLYPSNPPSPSPVFTEKPADIDTYTHGTDLLVRTFSTLSLPVKLRGTDSLPTAMSLTQRLSLNGYLPLSFLPTTTTITCPRCPINKRDKYLSLMMICVACYTCIDNIDICKTIPKSPEPSQAILWTDAGTATPSTPTDRTTSQSELFVDPREIFHCRWDPILSLCIASFAVGI